MISEKKASRFGISQLSDDRPANSKNALGLIPPPDPPRVRSRGADLKRTHLVGETTPSDRQHRQGEYLPKKEAVQKGHCARAPHLYFVRVFRTMPAHLRGCRIH